MFFGVCGEKRALQARSEPGSGPHYCTSTVTVLRGVISSLHQQPGLRETERGKERRCCFIASLFWAWELAVPLFSLFPSFQAFFVFHVWPSAGWETCWQVVTLTRLGEGFVLCAWHRLASSLAMWQRAITLTQGASAALPVLKTLFSDLQHQSASKDGHCTGENIVVANSSLLPKPH